MLYSVGRSANSVGIVPKKCPVENLWVYLSYPGTFLVHPIMQQIFGNTSGLVCECVRSIINFHTRNQDIDFDMLEMFLAFNVLNMTRTDDGKQNFSKKET